MTSTVASSVEEEETLDEQEVQLDSQLLWNIFFSSSPDTDREMPGLINRTSNAALPLTASEVTSCVSGYAFGMTASLTYGNSETQPFEGKGQGDLRSPLYLIYWSQAGCVGMKWAISWPQRLPPIPGQTIDLSRAFIQ